RNVSMQPMNQCVVLSIWQRCASGQQQREHVERHGVMGVFRPECVDAAYGPVCGAVDPAALHKWPTTAAMGKFYKESSPVDPQHCTSGQRQRNTSILALRVWLKGLANDSTRQACVGATNATNTAQVANDSMNGCGTIAEQGWLESVDAACRPVHGAVDPAALCGAASRHVHGAVDLAALHEWPTTAPECVNAAYGPVYGAVDPAALHKMEYVDAAYRPVHDAVDPAALHEWPTTAPECVDAAYRPVHDAVDSAALHEWPTPAPECVNAAYGPVCGAVDPAALHKWGTTALEGVGAAYRPVYGAVDPAALHKWPMTACTVAAPWRDGCLRIFQ
ncbi:12449_t:CDS:10, partial [Acaulospora colombiana]